MNLDKMKSTPVVVAIVVALITIVGWFGGVVKMPGQVMDEHVRSSRADHDSLRLGIDKSMQKGVKVEEGQVELKALMEGLIRGECLENPRIDLGRQGLLPKCRQLGIEPGQPGVAPAIVTPDSIP